MSATWNSGRLRIISTTRSPRPTPRPASAGRDAGRPGRRTRPRSTRPSRRRPSTAGPRRRACCRTVSRNRLRDRLAPRPARARTSLVGTRAIGAPSRRLPAMIVSACRHCACAGGDRGAAPAMSTALSTGRSGKPGESGGYCRQDPSRGDRWGARQAGSLSLRRSSGRLDARRSSGRSAVRRPGSSSSASTASVSAPSGRPAWRTVAGRARRGGPPAPASARRRPRPPTPRAAHVGVGQQVGHRVDGRDRGVRGLERGEHLGRRAGRRSSRRRSASSSSRCSTRPSNVREALDRRRRRAASSTRRATDSADVDTATHTPSAHR